MSRKFRILIAERPLTPPHALRVPRGTGKALRAGIARINERRLALARQELDAGAPLAHLLDHVSQQGADVLVVGARATSGLVRALLGSVAAGALDRSPVPVLIVP